jgi:hypothetical protein
MFALVSPDKIQLPAGAVVSYSNVNDYLPYRVPEIWLFCKKQLLIYQLQGEEYILQEKSLYFPKIQLQEVITRCLQIAYERNTSAAIRDLKQRLGNRPLALIRFLPP